MCVCVCVCVCVCFVGLFRDKCPGVPLLTYGSTENFVRYVQQSYNSAYAPASFSPDSSPAFGEGYAASAGGAAGRSGVFAHSSAAHHHHHWHSAGRDSSDGDS
jgi:hypothetical protein